MYIRIRVEMCRHAHMNAYGNMHRHAYSALDFFFFWPGHPSIRPGLQRDTRRGTDVAQGGKRVLVGVGHIGAGPMAPQSDIAHVDGFGFLRYSLEENPEFRPRRATNRRHAA